MSRNPSIPDCAKMVNQLKIDMTQLPGLQPGAPLTKDTQNDIECAQRVYELATLLSVKQEDAVGFERHVARVKTYYVDYGAVFKPSKHRSIILGLNLLRLLAQNRIAEFHTELELVPADVRADNFIDYPCTLEQFLMEGSYSRVTSAAAQMPDPSFKFFVTMLMSSMREKIAACAEKAYKELSLEAASKLLSLDGDALAAFCRSRQWRVVGNNIVFALDVEAIPAKEQVPSVELITRSLYYARELEQII